MKKGQTKYAVYFDQINQSKIIVFADDEDLAREKAERKWKKEYANPICGYVAEAVDDKK